MDSMDNPFDFLKKAKPVNIFKLVEKLGDGDAALVLTRLPMGLQAQVMAYLPEERHRQLMPALRDARQADNAEAVAAAGRIRQMLLGNRPAAVGQPANAPASPPDVPARPAPPAGAVPPERRQSPPTPRELAPRQSPAPYPPPARQHYPGRPVAPPPRVPESADAEPPRPAASGEGKSPLKFLAGIFGGAKDSAGKKDKPATASGSGKPAPWVPRKAETSPINGPALPGKPPPVRGDPLESPLARAGLMDIIGRAQEKLLPKGTHPSRPAKAGPPAVRNGGKTGAKGKGDKPPAIEGMLAAGRIRVDSTPRVIGPAARRPARPSPEGQGAGGRSVDGKAIMAAILREAGNTVRTTVREDDPGLFRELQNRMFVFDDLIFTEDNALARVFTVAPVNDSALALRFAAPALRDRVLRVVSPGRAEALREPPRGRAGVNAIEAAQQKVLDVALQLQAAGRILIDPRDPDLAGM